MLDFSKQEEDIIKHPASKCNMFTLTINLLTIVNLSIGLINIY